MSNWQLKSLAIDFREYGELKGKYVGKITFMNNDQDAFTFQLNDQQCDKYLKLVSEQVGMSAGELGQKIVESMQHLLTSNGTILQLQAKETTP